MSKEDKTKDDIESEILKDSEKTKEDKIKKNIKEEILEHSGETNEDQRQPYS